MELKMPTFTKKEMFRELATILLFEADHMILSSGMEMAKYFIGFETDNGEYLHELPEKVEHKRFNAFGMFERGFEYAFEPSLLNAINENDFQDLVVFMQGVPKVGGIFSGGEMHQFMTPDGFCQSVADAASARWRLEWDDMGASELGFTPRELALLANMTEGAVRNAMSDKSEFGIKPIPGTKNPVKFSHDESLRWLSGRRGFIAGPSSIKEDKLFLESLKKTDTALAFSSLIKKLSIFSTTRNDLEDLNVESWCDGTFQFDREVAKKLAHALDIDVPTFVGKALEVSLRRDSF
jgi:hypothetical protein